MRAQRVVNLDAVSEMLCAAAVHDEGALAGLCGPERIQRGKPIGMSAKGAKAADVGGEAQARANVTTMSRSVATLTVLRSFCTVPLEGIRCS